MLLNRFALFSSLTMSGSGELNNIGIVVAYSLRRLFSSYAGPIIRVRRTSNNEEKDFSASGAGAIDTAELLSWVGTGNSGYVVRWYDQSGGNYHAEQSAAARQPQIVENGAVMVSNSKPTLDFGNFRAVMSVTNNMHAQLHSENMPMAVFTVHTLVNTDFWGDVIFDIRRLNDHTSLFTSPMRYNSNMRVQKNAPGSAAHIFFETGMTFPLVQSLSSYLFNGTDATVYSNNSSAVSNNWTVAGVPAYQAAHLGGFQHSVNGQVPYLEGSIQEFVLYNVEKTADRQAIAANIMGYYGIN